MVEVLLTARRRFSVIMSANDRHPDQFRDEDDDTVGYRDFAGRRLHFLQIGLGTNTTFLQNIAGGFRSGAKTFSGFWMQLVSEEVKEFGGSV